MHPWRNIFIYTNASGYHDKMWLYNGTHDVERCELGRWIDANLESSPALNVS